MQISICCPYPKNLLLTVFGMEGIPKITPADIEIPVDYAPATLENERSAQIIRLRFQDDCTLGTNHTYRRIIP